MKRNHFKITEHEDRTKTVIHNGTDLSDLTSSYSIQGDSQSTTVVLEFADCRVEYESVDDEKTVWSPSE